MSSHRHGPSERSLLLPFEPGTLDGPPNRDQRDLMERPFFSLSKSRRVTPILYSAGGVEVEVHAVPEHGMASIWDADILIWAGSQIVDAANAGLPTSRFFRFTPYQLLTSVGRGTGKQQYDLLKRALTRLQSTAVSTTIRNGPQWRRHRFSWINEWEERILPSGRCEGMEFVLPDWFYQGVIDRSLVLSIDPAYFQLRGGIERWLYRVARKHAGRQPRGWAFQFRHLHAKSGSLARPSDFALDLRRIVARQPLPGYALTIEHDTAGAEMLRFWPADPVDKIAAVLRGIGRSGANPIGRSGASLSADQAHGSQPSLWGNTRIGDRKESKGESNFRKASDTLWKTHLDRGRPPTAKRRKE